MVDTIISILAIIAGISLFNWYHYRRKWLDARSDYREARAYVRYLTGGR
jgi:hypothetical protein